MARVSAGATSLRCSSHLPPISGSKASCKAGQIAARTPQAFDEPASDRIADRHEYDGDRPVDRAHCHHCRIAPDHDQLRGRGDQVQCRGFQPVQVAGRMPVDNAHIPPLGPAKRLQALLEGGHAQWESWIGFRHGREHADAPHSLGLLRARRERPRCRRAAEQRDELAPFPLTETHDDPPARTRLQHTQIERFGQ